MWCCVTFPLLQPFPLPGMGQTPFEITNAGTGCTLRQVRHNSTQRTAIQVAACAGVRSDAGESLFLGCSVPGCLSVLAVGPSLSSAPVLFAGCCCLPTPAHTGSSLLWSCSIARPSGQSSMLAFCGCVCLTTWLLW